MYRLVTRNSYEREMFDRASMKLGLDKAVLQRMGGKEMNQVRLVGACMCVKIWNNNIYWSLKLRKATCACDEPRSNSELRL